MSLYRFMFAESSTLKQPWFLDVQTGHMTTGYEMKKRTDALAQGLNSRLGLRSSCSIPSSHLEYGITDLIGIISPNSLDFPTVVWASHKLGCTVAPINGTSTADEIKHQFLLSRPSTVFAHEQCLDRVIEAAAACNISSNRIVVICDPEGLARQGVQEMNILTVEELIRVGERELSSTPHDSLEDAPSSIAFLCFSSGTTGLPKAVILSHSAIIANITQLKNASVPASRIFGGDRSLGLIPFSHIFGLVTLVHLCPHLGIETVVFRSTHSFPKLLQEIVRLRVGHFFLVPSLVNAFVKHRTTASHNLDFFRSAMIAAAPLDGELESSFQKLGGPKFLVTQVFGMTECGGMITGLPVGVSPRPGFVGTLLASTEAKIVDEDGHSLPPGQRGHLRVRGPQICLGYLGNGQATMNAFDVDGFLITGDVADMSIDGHFRIVDRAKRMIKNKGYQVSPAELEAHLLSLDLVEDAGVIGKPNDRCGEVPVAFVVLSTHGRRQDADTIKEAIQSSVRETKSTYKWLHAVHFVDTIPRLPSGKIIIRHLKQLMETAETQNI